MLSGAAGCVERIVAAQSEMSIRPIYAGMSVQGDAIAAFQAVGFDVVGMFPLSPTPGDWFLNEFDCLMIRRPALMRANQLAASPMGAPVTGP